MVPDNWSRNVWTTAVLSRSLTNPSARPVAGQTVVSTWRLAYAVCFGAVGRVPRSAQTLVSDPFWPNRASSSNQTSIRSPGWVAATSARRPERLF